MKLVYILTKKIEFLKFIKRQKNKALKDSLTNNWKFYYKMHNFDFVQCYMYANRQVKI